MKNILSQTIATLLCLSIGIRSAIAEEFNPRDISLKIKNASDPNGTYQNTSSYLIRQSIKVLGAKEGEFKTEITFKAPDNLRLSYFFKDKLISSIIIKDAKAWKISGIDGEINEINGIELERVKLFNLISFPKNMLCDIFEDIKIEKLKINQEEFYEIFCHPKNKMLAQITFFVSANNFLQQKIFTVNEKGEPYSAEIIKYSFLNNIFIPAETHVLSGGIKQIISLDEFLINPEIDDAIFTIKEKSKNLDGN